MEKLELKETIKILNKNGLAVIPTDTIYGIVTKALSIDAVERLYRVKGRRPEKPFIILISSEKDLSKFGVEISKKQEQIINNLWPGPFTIIFECDKKYLYLHRGTNTLAFRLPASKKLRDLILRTGPLVAPSANPEGKLPAKNIKEAMAYFGKDVDSYLDGGEIRGEPSTLIDLADKSPKVIRGDQSILRFLD